MSANLHTHSVAFELSEVDSDAFQNYFLQHSKFNRRRVRLWQLAAGIFGSLLPFSMGVFLLSEWQPSDPSRIRVFAWVAIAWGIGYGIYAIVFLPENSRRSTLKRLKRFNAAHNVDPGYGRRTIRVDGDSLICEWALGNAAIQISKMSEPVETESHVFLFVDDAQAFIVPKDKVLEGDLDSLVRKFRAIRDLAGAKL